MSDIMTLQICPDSTTFTKAKDLFVKKWIKEEEDFVEYLQQQWLSSHDGWHEGVGDNYLLPSTNNGLEAFNRVLKDEETLRERIPLGRFFPLCLETCTRWSKWYEQGLKEIALNPSIDLPDWTAAYQWVKLNKKVTSAVFDEVTEYYCPSGELLAVSNEQIRQTRTRKWTSFNLFRKRAFSLWIVKIIDQDWQNGTCSCPKFRKEFKCKHLSRLAIHLKLVKPPAAAKQVPIGEKRKRGRPKKAKTALLVD